MAPITAVVIGSGQRGNNYAAFSRAYPAELTIVAVAEPRKQARDRFQSTYNIEAGNVFETWEDLVTKDKMADVAIITTQDRMHKAPAIGLANLGYHILLEKPMAVTQEDCQAIVNIVKKKQVVLGVCHVLRYYPQYMLLKKLLTDGVIGQICHISHTEPVGFWHFAHSYVRGNWRNEQESSNSLLAKCCHDLDLISYWMGDNKCEKIASFGSLMHFTPANKPEGAGENCMTCRISDECAFAAQKIYTVPGKWPTSVVTSSGDIEDVGKALSSGPYGRCVYSCDNDVMSNQVVSMQFKDGATASVNMVALTKKVCERETYISGTKGEIKCGFQGPIEVYDFLTRQTSYFTPTMEDSIPDGLGGHGGADFYMIKTFIEALRKGNQKLVLAGPEETLYSHTLVFAAEKARLDKSVIDMDSFLNPQ